MSSQLFTLCAYRTLTDWTSGSALKCLRYEKPASVSASGHVWNESLKHSVSSKQTLVLSYTAVRTWNLTNIKSSFCHILFLVCHEIYDTNLLIIHIFYRLRGGNLVLCWLPLCHGHRKLLQCSNEVAYKRTSLFLPMTYCNATSSFFFFFFLFSISFTEQNQNHDSMKSGGMHMEETWKCCNYKLQKTSQCTWLLA